MKINAKNMATFHEIPVDQKWNPCFLGLYHFFKDELSDRKKTGFSFTQLVAEMLPISKGKQFSNYP